MAKQQLKKLSQKEFLKRLGEDQNLRELLDLYFKLNDYQREKLLREAEDYYRFGPQSPRFNTY